MADSEDDILKEAIAGTESEIFSEAVGKDLPSTEGGLGDRSVEEMGEGLEGQNEPEETASEVNAKGEGDDDGEAADDGTKGAEGTEGDGKTAPQKDPKTGQFVKAKTEGDETGKGEDPDADLLEADGKPKQRVPVKDLIAERKSRRAAEARVKELETTPNAVPQAEIERLVNARVAELLGQQTPKQAAQTEAPAKKDIFEDPDGFVADLTATIERSVTQKFVAADLQRTAEGPDAEKFKVAYAALTSLDKNDPAARAQVQRIWNSATPGADLLKWHGRQEVQRVVGDDPEAFAERVRKETRESLAKDPAFRKELLAALQIEAKAGEGGGTPRHVARMPKSLNGAAGGQSQGGGGGAVDNSERGVFDFATGG